jgi:hypothetical protein
MVLENSESNQMNKSKRMRWTRHVASMGATRNAYTKFLWEIRRNATICKT